MIYIFSLMIWPWVLNGEKIKEINVSENKLTFIIINLFQL